jgi:repressor LexA
VFEHIAGLKEKGLLSANPGKARSLSLTRKAQKLLKEAPVENDCQSDLIDSIPLLGTIAAGAPIEAIENVEQISLQSEFGSQDTFALKVQGDSMTGDGIFDGDYVVCKKTQTAQNGKIVAAIVDSDSATVKRFFRETGRIRLEPSNPNYEPISA